MIYAVLFVLMAIIALAWLRLEKRYGKYVRGEEPFSFSILVDIPFDEYTKYRTISDLPTIPFAIIQEDKLDDTTTRTRTFVKPPFKDMKPADVITDVTIKRIGGTEEVSIHRIVEQDGKKFPRGRDHYITVLSTAHKDQTMIIHEERGVFPSLLKFLRTKRGAEAACRSGGKQTRKAWQAARAAD